MEPKPEWCGESENCPRHNPFDWMEHAMVSWRDERGALCSPPECVCEKNRRELLKDAVE